MGTDKQQEIESVYDKLLGQNGQLCMYQKCSVEKICDHLKNNSRALLADEVGMGKTYIAKGIIAKMVSEYSKIDKRPYRVGYICPNQDIAEQNYRKLRLYSEYSNPYATLTDNDYTKIRELQNSANRAGIKNSVYTRILDWLLELQNEDGDVNDFFENMDEGVRFYYVDKQEGKGNTKAEEWSYQQNPLNNKSKRDIVSDIRDYINSTQIISKYIGRIEYTHYKEAHTGFYYANKSFIEALNGGMEEDSRLSMSHLFSWEREKQNADSIMIIDALTSQTSFNIREGNGTVDERALLQATISMFSEIAPFDSELKLWNTLVKVIANASRAALQSNEFENYEQIVNNYKSRLRVFTNQLTDMKNEIKLKDSVTVPEIRRAFIEYNVNKIKYDLMILDEFQNFRELIDPKYRPKNSNGQENVAYILIDRLLKADTKTVLLSATPFSLDRFDGSSLLSYMDEESEPLNVNEIYAQFEVVIKFLINDETKATNWINCWKNNRLTIKDIVTSNNTDKKNKCEELLFEAGVFRNERAYASKAKMINEKVFSLDNDISYLIKANKCLGKEADSFRSEYGLTPWALSFIDGIKICSSKKSGAYIDKYTETSDGSSDFAGLFLPETALDGSSIVDEAVPEFKKLDELTLGDDKYPHALLLWIPACKSKNKLRGVFEGNEGFSKTLVFCKNRITPKALTYLLANNCYAVIKDTSPLILADDNTERIAIEEYIRQQVYSKCDEERKTYLAAYEIVNYIINQLFKGNCIWQRVILKAASLYPELKDKSLYKKLQWYFEAGCFSDMIDEYFSLLRNEYDNNPYRMKAVVRRLNLNVEKAVKIYVNNHGKIESKILEPACGYAMGIYNTYDKDKNPKPVYKMSHVKKLFNSPFWPFVMISTSIGTEGIDLHWYATNIVHWSLPAVAGDIEQREGRLLRFNCHAIRLNENVKQEDAVRPGWEDSDMYPKVISFAEDDCYYINRYIFVQKNSPYEAEQKNKKKVIDTYRIMLGQQEIVYDPSQFEEIKHSLAENYICLSPYWDMNKKLSR